ncbi:RbsD/FucU domain-containing protein [uncultured Amnibacterium sp.]|uniref:RbsD/FucU domain-containing protein n=1 Tax=uncultured Amnibacterium sp. TaxID=1631851 RepID=UPI0035C9ADE5
MLTTPLIHPPLLAALAAAGHGSQVLLADGNYPHATGRSERSVLVHLDVAPGLLTVPQVLVPMLAVLPIESAQVMATADERPAPAHNEYRALLGGGVGLSSLERFAFYGAARGPDVAVVVATGDQRHYANLLLTVGVVPE